jgi:DNA-binding NarL/FixJ family response regulator
MVCSLSSLNESRFSSIANQSPGLDPLSQTELLKTEGVPPSAGITIISPSYLLREAIFNLVSSEFQRQATESVQGWVLLDYGLGRDVLVRTVQDYRIRYPEHYLMVLELLDDPDVILDCIVAGAHAYALQGMTGEQIVSTIQQVNRRVFQYPIEITDRLMERLAQLQRGQLPRPKALTQREWDVLHYIEQKQGDREIAAVLYISVRTVKHHVHNLLGKLNVQSRWQAAQLARDNGWLETDRS